MAELWGGGHVAWPGESRKDLAVVRWYLHRQEAAFSAAYNVKGYVHISRKCFGVMAGSFLGHEAGSPESINRRAVLTAGRRGGAGSIGDDPFLTLVIEIRVVGLTIRPVGFRDVGDLVIGVTFGGMSRIRRAELWATKRRVLMPGEGPVSGRPPGSGVRAERSVGASFPFPLAPAEVAYLNGHRPFSLGGGNGSKCPHTVIGSS